MGGKNTSQTVVSYANRRSNSAAHTIFGQPAPLPQKLPGACVYTLPTKYKWLAQMDLGERATTHATTTAASGSIT
jgi:hypothetical protein